MASRIADEIKQTRPFPSKSQETAVALLRTADVVRRMVSGVVEPAGITIQQYNVLRILRGAGERGLPTLEIAERMIESTPGITRLIDRLEEKQLVSRERCKTDRRQVFCRIAPAGNDLLTRLDPEVERADAVAMGAIPESQLDDLLRLLAAVREAIHANLDPPDAKGQ